MQDICIRQVKGFGRQKNYLDQYGENEYSLAYVPKVEIHVWVDDEHLESVITRIATGTANTVTTHAQHTCKVEGKIETCHAT